MPSFADSLRDRRRELQLDTARQFEDDLAKLVEERDLLDWENA